MSAFESRVVKVAEFGRFLVSDASLSAMILVFVIVAFATKR